MGDSDPSVPKVIYYCSKYLFNLISSRNSLDEIYFGRTRDVVNSLRSIQPLGEVEEREKKRKGILADLVAMNKKRAIDI